MGSATEGKARFIVMKIMELCLSPDLGGLELYVYRASMKLAETDKVHAVINQKGKLAERFRNTDLPVSYLDKGFKVLPLFSALKLAGIIDRCDIDVIHMHWGRDLSVAALAKWFSKKKPRLVYTRQMQITRNKDDIYHRFLYKQVDVFITITKVLAKLARSFLSEADKHKVVPLYYGVEEPDKFLSQDEKQQLRKKAGFVESDFIVALFGRIEEYKGQHVVIDAIARLKQQDNAVKGLIVGHAMDKEYFSAIKSSVRERGIEHDIHFMDFVENPQEWMQACDVVVLATKEETFGLVLAEAMQSGVAVIGTNSGGVPEIIDHDKNGFLFEYGDEINLCKYILELKEDENKLLQYAKAGQEKAKQLFDINKHYVELRKLLAGTR